MINLFVNYYLDQNAIRQQELDLCIQKNTERFDRVIILVHHTDVICLCDMLSDYNQVIIVLKKTRPDFNDFFELTRWFAHDINVISNLDICFDDSLDLVNEYYIDLSHQKDCMALSRWDSPTQLHKNAHGSQDCWIFYGAVPFMQGADFTLGVAGCDNKMAYIIEKNDYRVINPSKTIKCLHVHDSEIRNYDVNEDRKRIRAPFKIIYPTEL